MIAGLPTAQALARFSFVQHGGVTSEPTADERTDARKALLEKQDDLASALGIDPALVDLTMRFLEAA